MVDNIDHFKQKLEEEKALLEQEMATIGMQVPDHPGIWEARANVVSRADSNLQADRTEELEENTAMLDQLALRYANILRALKKIDDGTYGKDELDGEDIEHERLEANPAARTRIVNIEREGELK